jgi:hypothetical protein
MWRPYRRFGSDNVPTWTEPAPAVSPEALAAAPEGPAPLTDAAVIAQLKRDLEVTRRNVGDLQRDLAAERRTVGSLQEKLATRPDPIENCYGCEGHRKTIADMDAELRRRAARITQLELADPKARAKTWQPKTGAEIVADLQAEGGA